MPDRASWPCAGACRRSPGASWRGSRPPCKRSTSAGGRPRAEVPAAEALSKRARRLALSLVELGEDVEATERQLLRWRFHPTLAREATRWAWEHHATALAAARTGPDDDGPGPAAA